MPESPIDVSLAQFADSLVRFSQAIGQTQEQIEAHHLYLRLNPDSHRAIMNALVALYGWGNDRIPVGASSAPARRAHRSLAFGSIPPGKHYRHA